MTPNREIILISPQIPKSPRCGHHCAEDLVAIRLDATLLASKDNDNEGKWQPISIQTVVVDNGYLAI